MSKLFKNFVGIDISKNWFDASVVLSAEGTIVHHQQFSQTPAGYKSFMQWLKEYNVAPDETTLFCMEYTGIYNTGLVNFLVHNQAAIWVEMPLRIKRCSGLERGGDDKSASHKIAWYAYRYQDHAKLWQPADSNIDKLKNLIAQRERLITSLKHLKVPLQELLECGCVSDAKQLIKMQQPVIRALEKARQNVEKLIQQTIAADEQLHHTIQIMRSVSGIGQVTATAMLVYTRGFTAFTTAKELACYCGVVPFSRTSGSSVKYRSTVSPFANMKLKKLLHLCAMSAIQNDKEMKAYFEKKLLEGKNKMCIINAVRNKLVHRVFAVVRDNRMYEDNYVRSCA
jgi:transposase